MIPWIALNAGVGVLLFESYNLSRRILAAGSFEYSDAFIGGTIAGVFQTLLSVPLANIQKSLSNVADLREKNMVEAIKGVLPKEAKLKFLYQDVKMHVVRDGLGFGVFFGVFESALHVAKAVTVVYVKKSQGDELEWLAKSSLRESVDRLEKEWHDMKAKPHGWSFALVNGATIVVSGATAGMTYQLVSHPIKQVYRNGFRVNGAFSGISSRLMRSIPSSALGLLLYEMVRE